MPQRIQARPLGLLSFLGLQGTGKNPTDLSDYVQPVLDLDYLYNANGLEAQNATTLLAVNGDTAELEVPAGEVWRLIALGGYVGQPSASPLTVDVSLEIAPGGTSATAGVIAVPVLNPQLVVLNAATETFRFGGFVPQRLALAAGSVMRMRLNRDPGGGATVSLRVIAGFQRLRG